MKKSTNNYPLSSVFTDGLFRFFIFILLFIALLNEQTNLILISILLLAMFYGTEIWSYYSGRKIHYSFDGEQKKGFPGEQVLLQSTIENNKLLPVWLKLKIPVDKKLNGYSNSNSGYICENFSLLWYDQNSWQWKLTSKDRGCFRIGPPFLETGDLLGFFKRKKYLSQSVEMIVYPKPISLNIISSPVKELFGSPGLKSPVKDPVYPVATQDYYHGDPAKYIHWKASAKHNKLQSKIFEPSSQQKTLFIIDVSTYRKINHSTFFEKTLEAVAAMSMEFDRRGIAYGIISNGKIYGKNMSSYLSIATGSAQLSRVMELLARIDMKKDCSIEKILFQDHKILSGTGCIYCTYRVYKKNIQIAQFLIKHNIPVYFMAATTSRYLNSQSIKYFLLDEVHGGYINLGKNI